MTRPRILVLAAAGKTGFLVARQLLAEGFPVTAFVHRHDPRSTALAAQGADIIIGSMTDIVDMRRAMVGVQRAYFCTPTGGGTLKAAAVFTAVAAEQGLESVVAMSQWLASPLHPAVQTRETWLADRMLALLPHTAVTTINVGFFADNDMQVLAFAAQFGRLLLPYGAGRNAAPSNEDIAAVIAEIAARPDGHAGKTYRPTGPQLLSGDAMAAILTEVLGHSVTYVNAPLWMVRRVMKGVGFSEYIIAQTLQYYQDYQRDAFAVGAPTDVVHTITGREPEDFATIARHYAATMPDATRRVRTQMRLLAMLPLWMLRPQRQTAPYLALDDFSDRQHVRLSADAAEWQRDHTPQTPTIWI